MAPRDQKPDSDAAHEPTLAWRDNPPSVSVILDSFEQAWQSQSAPDIASFLPSNGSRAQVLSELVLVDLECRWRRSLADAPTLDPGSNTLPDRPRLEDYVACFPELGSPTDLPLEMITAEYRVRRVWGDRPAVDEYLSRFPGYGDVLRQRLAEIDGQQSGTQETHSFAQRSLLEDTAAGRPRRMAGAAGEILQHIGRYKVERNLGEGAFGRVYLAWDGDLKRRVAIKVPHRKRLQAQSDAELYLAEAQAVASLDHPHIVPVYDVGRTPDGDCYVVSKLIEGSDLAGYLEQHNPSFDESAQLIASAAEALQHTHNRGLIHRDIKPANILVDSRGTPYLADFGLALREDFGMEAALAGTPAYMSPEQARGEGHLVDSRSDIFSLGVVLYELLAGVGCSSISEAPRSSLSEWFSDIRVSSVFHPWLEQNEP